MEPEQALLQLRAAGLPAIDPRLVVGFLQPMLQQLSDLRRVGSRLPLLALNGPVGAGKSSLGRALAVLAPALDLRLLVVSIDDLYLPWPERQRRLAGNPFAVSRVPPGSHDLDVLLEGLASWRHSGILRLPRFDKTLAQGQGDRCGWHQGPCDVLVLEGWLMGCRALGAEGLAIALAAVDLSRPGPDGAPALEPMELDWLATWDRLLETYGPLWQACDGLWVLRPLSWALPRRWRFQAEARQRRNGGGWLPPVELERLVRSSLCSLPPVLYQDPLALDPWLVPEPEAMSEPAKAIWPRLTGPPSTVTGDSDPELSSLAAGTDAWASLSTGAQPDHRLPVKARIQGSKTVENLAASPLASAERSSQPAQAMAVACATAAAAAAVAGLTVEGLAVLDGRRRCVGLWRRQQETQASPSESSSLMG